MDKTGVLLFVTFAVICSSASSQLVILEPTDLAKEFPSGRIEGSTAAFGTPYYGERLAGNLIFFDKTGCEDDDYNFVSPKDNPISAAAGSQQTSDPENSSRRLQGGGDNHSSRGEKEGLRTIVMVRRGECHFVTKVLVAEKKGAAAVVIVDSEGTMSNARDVQKIIMADDGWGDGVVIPSLLIGEVDGILLINKLMKDEKVIVELAWNIPKASPVQMDQWLSPAFADTNVFLKDFAPYAKQLKHKLDYHPHYVVITLPGDFKEMCTDSSGRFCGWDPDKGGKTTGKEIMEETVRQLCLWETTQKINEFDPNSGFYSEEWWSYVEELSTECPHKGSTKQDESASEIMDMTKEEYEQLHTLSEECSYGLMSKVGANVGEVKKCYKHNFNSLLTHELLNKAWSSTAVMINNWRYSGPLEPEQLTRTLCTGFENEIEECRALFHPSRMELMKDGLLVERVEGMPMWEVICVSILAVMVGIFLAVIVYWYYIHPRIRSSLRYSIMDDVRKDNSSKYDTQHLPTDVSSGPTSARSIVTLPPSSSPRSGIGGANNRAEPVGRQFSFEEDEEENHQQRKGIFVDGPGRG